MGKKKIFVTAHGKVAALQSVFFFGHHYDSQPLRWEATLVARPVNIHFGFILSTNKQPKYTNLLILEAKFCKLNIYKKK